MAFGPVLPDSVQYIGTVGNVFPSVHVGAGANAHRMEGHGVIASLGADAVIHFEWWLPTGSLPAGTLKLLIWAVANATSGVATFNPAWNVAAAEVSASGLTLNAEGQSTITWGASDNDQFKELKITLDASTPVAGNVLVLHMTHETTNYTLAQIMTYKAGLIWE